MKDKSNYGMLRHVLENNLKLIRLIEKENEQEKELISYNVIKGLIKFGNVLEKSYNFPES